MTTLFNLEQYNSRSSRPREIDSYWDLPEEVILATCSGKVEDNGQTTLFYDSSDEPPEPDDYPDQESFDQAWGDWGRTHPDFKPDMTFPEQVEEEFIEDVVLEKPSIEFVEDGIYWHEGRQLKAKIIKIYKSVGKAQVYFERDIEKHKIFLSELSTLPEQDNQDRSQQPRTNPDKPLINQWVEKYYVTRSGNKYWYDRYCYYQKRIKHIHIPSKPDLKEKVEKAIALGKLPHEIEKLIKSA